MDYQKAAEDYLQTLDGDEKNEWWCTEREVAEDYVRAFAARLQAGTATNPENPPMSSTPKRFTRYDAEHHDQDTVYVLAEEHDAAVRAMADYAAKAQDHVFSATTRAAAEQLIAQATESMRLQRLADNLMRELEQERLRHAATRAELASAPTYPVENPANPLLTVESGGIRYVLEVRSDEDGEWFEVKSATPTEPQTLADFTHSARPERRAHIEAKASQALAAYRAEQREDDEASRA